MAEGRGGGDFIPIGADPDLQAARQRAINQAIAPDTQPPPPEHPAVTYARNLLSPMGPYGGASTVSMPPGFNPYAAPADQRGAAQGGGAGFTVPGDYQYPAQPIVGPDLSQIGNDPSNPVGWLNQQLAKVGETPTSKFQLPGLTQISGLFPGSTLGDIGGLFAPPTQAQSDNPLFALGPEGNFAGNIGEALGPAARMVGNKVLGGAQDVLKGRLPEFASQAAGEGRPDLGLGGPQSNLERMLAEGKDFTRVPKAEAAASEAANPSVVGQERAAAGTRYQPEIVPNSSVKGAPVRWTIRDMVSGKTEPLTFAKQEAAQAKADQFNTPTPVNPFAVPQEAAIQGALTQIPREVATAVRQTARSVPDMTAETMAATPGLRTHLDSALSTARLPATDENAASLAQALLDREKARPSKGNLAAAAQTPTVTAGVPGGAGPSDYARLADLATAAGATPDEVSALVGGKMPEVQQRVEQVTAEMGGTPPKPPSDLPPITGEGGPTGKGGTLFPENQLQATVSRKFSAKTVGDVVTQAMYNSIVFPTTNLVHSFGSTASSVANFPERMLLSGVDEALHGLGVTKQHNFTVDATVAGLNAQLHGMGNAIAHDLPDTILHGTNVLTDVDLPKETATALLRGEYGSNIGLKTIGALGKVAGMGDYPLRVIAAVDNAIIRGLTASRLMEQGYLDGINQGLRGPELHDYAANYFANAGSKALEDATLAARTQINRQPAGQIGSEVLRAKGLSGIVGTVLLPFFNTKLNILKAATTWSPLGFARLIPKEIPVLGYFGKNVTTEAARVQAVTRAAAGTLLIYPVWQQVLSDNITGDGPTDPKQRALWVGDPNNPSHVERAIRLPFGWVTYSKIPVLGDYLAAIADTAQAVRDSKDPDVSGAQAAVSGLSQYFGKEEQGIGDAAATVSAIYDAWTKPNDAQAQAAVAQQLANRGFELTPWSGAMRSYETINDPTYRRIPPGTTGLGARSLADYQAQIPFLNQNFPAGGTRTPGITGGAGSLLPVRVSGETAPAISPTASGMPPTATQESDRLAAADKDFKPLVLPSNKLGLGTKQELPLSGNEYLDFARYAGDERGKAVSALMLRPDYQGASTQVQGRMYKTAVSAADTKAESEYLSKGVIKADDPKLAMQEAVLGFHVQSSERDRAYWVALLDRAGKLTPDVAKAITDSQPEQLPGEAPPRTVEEYLKAAPLIHQYLSLPPYGTTSHPIGTPDDWAAVAAFTKQQSVLEQDYIRNQKMFPAVAKVRAQVAVLKTIISMVQRNLFLNGAQLENPQRKLLATKNPTLGHFVANTTRTQEQPGQYQNFPFGAP